MINKDDNGMTELLKFYELMHCFFIASRLLTYIFNANKDLATFRSIET